MASDTTAEAARVQREVWARLGPDRRVELAAELSEDVRRLTLEGLADRHPDDSPQELVRRLIQLWHGVDLDAIDHDLAEA